MVDGTRPSQACSVQGEVYLEMRILFTKGAENELHCVKSSVKHINGNTDTAKNHHLMVMFVVIATLPAIVNEFFLLPMFAQSGVEVSRS